MYNVQCLNVQFLIEHISIVLFQLLFLIKFNFIVQCHVLLKCQCKEKLQFKSRNTQSTLNQSTIQPIIDLVLRVLYDDLPRVQDSTNKQGNYTI